MNKKIILPILALVIGVILYLSLSTKQSAETTKAAQITAPTEKTMPPAVDLTPLMKHLPNETFAFQTWNFASTANEKIGNGLMIKGVSGTIDAFIKAGLIPSESNKQSALSTLVVYAAGDLAKSFEIGAVATNKPGENLTTKLETLLAAIKQDGTKTTEETFEGLKGFSFEVKEPVDETQNTEPAAEKTPKFVYLAASDSMLFANSSKESLSALIKRSADTATTPALYDSELKRARELLPQDGSEIGFGLIDVRSVVNQAEKYIPSDKVSAEDLDKFLKNPPLSSIAMQRSNNGSLKDRIVLLPPAGETNTVLTSLLDGATGSISASKTPNTTAIFLSIDGGVLNKLVDTAVLNAPEENKASLLPVKEILSSFKSLSLGLKANLGGSPFPDLSIIIDVANSAELIGKLKGMAGEMATQSGFGGMQWQDKTVEEANVTYMLSPFGVGAYLADLKGSVIIGTSEGAIRDAVLTDSGKSVSLASNFNADIKTRLSENKLPIVYVLNLKALAELIEGTLANFSMFTGGKPPIEQAQLDMLKKSGTTQGFVGVRNGAVEIIQEYQS